MKNRYEIRGDVTAIFLDRKDGTRLETMINTSDLPKVKKFPNKWLAQWIPRTKSFYVIGHSLTEDGRNTTIKLHRFLLDFPEGKVIDHINHDTLNNTRKNLRIVTHQQNAQNKKGALCNSASGIRGVSFHQQRKKWKAEVNTEGRKIYLGLFTDIKDAEKAVIEARKQYMPYSTN